MFGCVSLGKYAVPTANGTGYEVQKTENDVVELNQFPVVFLAISHLMLKHPGYLPRQAWDRHIVGKAEAKHVKMLFCR